MNREFLFQNEMVLFEKKDDIGIIYLNNGRYNKVTQPCFIEVEELEKLIIFNKLKALIITGLGKNFSTGADVDNFVKYKNNLCEFKESLIKGKKLLDYIETLPIVTVALINGACFGAGFEIALSCQFRIGCANTLLAFPESNLGIMPGMAGTYRLHKLIGKSNAIQMIISGEIITLEKATQLGIIDSIVDKDDSLNQTIAWIKSLVKGKTLKQINKIIECINCTNKDSAYSCEVNNFSILVKDMLNNQK